MTVTAAGEAALDSALLNTVWLQRALMIAVNVDQT